MTPALDAIRAVAMDVDGVLTDGSFWWGAHGEELKRFCFADSTGIRIAMKSGLRIALISGDSSEEGMALVQRYADRLGITDIYKGCHDKGGAIREFADRHRLQLSEVCFVGDDTIDIPAMKIVGVAVAPADAQAAAKSVAQWVTHQNGGNGAIREVLEAILGMNGTNCGTGSV
jgi:3-deoxy-D-manno-octulosonate 8-phosphate phosphatase (KDO 8-P phosphatase)